MMIISGVRYVPAVGMWMTPTDNTVVCEKNTPPENHTIRSIGFRSTKSGAG